MKQETSQSFPEMTELPPGNDNGGVPLSLPSTSAEATAAGSKRFRRPSVRLGEIGGDQLYNHHGWQGRKPKWNKKDMSKPSARTRALTNLSSGYENTGALDDEREGNVDVGSWRVKKRVGSSPGAAQRVRSNWVSRIGEMDELDGLGFRDFSREDSESPLRDGDIGFYGNSSELSGSRFGCKS